MASRAAGDGARPHCRDFSGSAAAAQQLGRPSLRCVVDVRPGHRPTFVVSVVPAYSVQFDAATLVVVYMSTTAITPTGGTFTRWGELNEVYLEFGTTAYGDERVSDWAGSRDRIHLSAVAQADERWPGPAGIGLTADAFAAIGASVFRGSADTHNRGPAAHRRDAAPIGDAGAAPPSRQPHRAPARSPRKRSGLPRARPTATSPHLLSSLPPLTRC